MFTRCLFCRKPFPENGQLAHMPHGRRIAFDPTDGRLWAICSGCYRWNLIPIESREAALYELERVARDHGRLVAHTAHVSLLNAGTLSLVRVGDASLVEQAWWRYGRELRKRKASFESTRSKVSAAAFGAAAWVGDVLGFVDDELPLHWTDTPMADILRWRRFGWAAWHGRETCPFCNSSLRALRYELSWWVYPLQGSDGRIGVGVPCQRCDPWTPEKIYQLHGDVAENALRRILAYQNIAGASERRIADAARAIEHVGSAGEFALDATRRRETLWRMGSLGTVALEIALNESVERRMLDLEVRSLEWMWKQEEELARIIDRELTPRRLLEAHLRHLPIRLRPRPHPRFLASEP
ncbi:MAG: hypothetical protein AMXMBFR53_19020 [Gemmatimonadota bacterium]